MAGVVDSGAPVVEGAAVVAGAEVGAAVSATVVVSLVVGACVLAGVVSAGAVSAGAVVTAGGRFDGVVADEHGRADPDSDAQYADDQERPPRLFHVCRSYWWASAGSGILGAMALWPLRSLR